jgi:hypothetical protein
VRKIVWHAEAFAGSVLIAKRGDLRQARFAFRSLACPSKYLRLEIVDALGRKAWSNPIWRDARTGRWRD